MIVPGIFVCIIFMISVCMFIVSKTLIVRAGGAIWVNPFATVLFNVCSAVTEECCVLYPWCVGVFEMLCKEEGSSPVCSITERTDMVLYEVPLSMSLLVLG